MKLIKQISLHFQQGTSDKVYEVDLCEVTITSDQPARYVVNFRYGRRGTTLRDGTKTVAPVDRDQAERIFNRLVSSKLDKGYLYTAGSDVLNGGTPPVRPAEERPQAEEVRAKKLDPRAEAVLRRIAEGHQSKAKWPLSRAVWRAGELGLKQAEPLLLPLIGTGSLKGRSPDQPMLDYCIAAALARCGTGRSVPALRTMLADKSVAVMVRRMAAEALLQLLDAPSRETLIQDAIAQLPAPLVEPARDGPAEVFAERLNAYLQSGGDTLIVDALYRIDNQYVRPALIELLRTADLQPPYFQRLRHIFKAAEVRRDGEVFGLLAYRFELQRAMFRNSRYNYCGSSSAKPTVGPNAEKAFSFETKLYLRRRIWRTLSRLGQSQDTDYVPMAVGVLLPFTDEDARPPHSTIRYDWSEYHRTRQISSRRVHSDSYAPYWAFSQILYANSPRYQPDHRRRYFECVEPYEPYEPGGQEPDEREEAFPELWQAAPQGLLHLLHDSRCEAVHRFAAKTLRTCTDFCNRLDIDALLMLLAAPYTVTIELGFELAVSRYDPNSPDKALVLALANSELERARAKSHQWIEAGRTVLFRDTDFIVALVTARFADTRVVARDVLRTITLDESTSHTIIGRLMAKLQSLVDGDGPLAADVAETMLRVFGRQLRRIGPEVIRDLLGHTLPEVQRFAGDLVLNHDRLAKQPPEDVLRALLGATDPLVREVGVRIIGQLPDDVLKRSIDVLFALSRSEHADIREAIRPVVRRLAIADRAFAAQIATMFVEAMLVPGAAEGVPTHTCRLLREDFGGHLSSISAEMVFRLLQSRSGPAQEVGGMLLATNVQPSEISVQQIVKLASSDILSVRQAAWQMCREGIDRLRGDAATAVRLVDAKWEDSRKFGFQFIRDHFAAGELRPVVLVSICDSVRPDVQQFGREMITRLFQEEMGQEYLMRLSEHPTASMQAFTTNFLDRYAADSPDRLRELTPYFISVLSRVNRGRVAKDRVLTFLEQEATKSEAAARTVAEILTRQSATCAIGDRARTIEIMARLQSVYPDILLPLTVRPVEVRGGV